MEKTNHFIGIKYESLIAAILLNVKSEKITVDDILPEGIGKVEEVETESFLKVAITELGKCKTVTGMNNKFREIRGLAAYMFLDDAEKNIITEVCKTKKAELNEKK